VEWYWQGKTEVLEKNLSNCHFEHHKPHADWTGIEPGSPQWWEYFFYPVFPEFQKCVALCKVSKLRPFVLLVKSRQTSCVAFAAAPRRITHSVLFVPIYTVNGTATGTVLGRDLNHQCHRWFTGPWPAATPLLAVLCPIYKVKKTPYVETLCSIMQFGRGVLDKNLPNSVSFVKIRSVRTVFYLKAYSISNRTFHIWRPR